MSSPHPDFGGFSGLSFDPETSRLLAVSDQGYWLSADLVFDAAGDLSGLGNARLRPLLDHEGKPHTSKVRADAEELLAMDQGRFLVSFERDHRLEIASPGEAARPFDSPEGLAQASANSGIEAMARLGDGRYFLLTEDLSAGDGWIRGWVGEPGAWTALRYPRFSTFKPTAAARLKDGDVVVLERHFAPLTGVAIRIVRFGPEAFSDETLPDPHVLATLRMPLNIDNMEAVTVVRRAGEKERLLIMSDDNFNPLQRTLILQFELPPS